VGFYDQRCMVTGVSLKGARTVLVLPGRTGDAHYPIALPVGDGVLPYRLDPTAFP
jgi:hypothetical protein